MAYFLFTKAIIEGDPIKVFNNGDMRRDFTYIDDIVDGICHLIDQPAIPNLNFNTLNPQSSSSWCPYRILNIGNSNPVALMDFIKEIEESVGKKAKKIYLPLQEGDVPKTFSDSKILNECIQFKPNTPIKKGINEFVKWYKNYYKV